MENIQKAIAIAEGAVAAIEALRVASDDSLHQEWLLRLACDIGDAIEDLEEEMEADAETE